MRPPFGLEGGSAAMESGDESPHSKEDDGPHYTCSGIAYGGR